MHLYESLMHLDQKFSKVFISNPRDALVMVGEVRKFGIDFMNDQTNHREPSLIHIYIHVCHMF